jgi:putative addiction module component (TIGR02574 family)
MSRDTAEILKEALALPPEARAALVDSLLDSLDSEIDEDAEAAWQREIVRRVRELDAQAVTPVPWSEVRSRLMGKLGDER